jgi:hypothetical protein
VSLRIRAHSLFLAAVIAAATFLTPSPAHAQRRGRPGGRAVVVAAPVAFGYGFYDPFWAWGPGWGPGWGYPGWFGPYGPSLAGRFGSARIQVTPRAAEVYVDGYLAGTVDDFDGVFQRLNVLPGEHELTIYLEGYQTLTQKVLFRPGATVNLRDALQPNASGEVTGPRPVASAPPAAATQGPGRPGPDPQDAWPGPGGAPQADFGTLSVRVQPADATLLVDGEEWSAPEGDGPIRIDLPDGPHELEVRRDGLSTYRRTVQVRAGRTVTVNVSLTR